MLVQFNVIRGYYAHKGDFPTNVFCMVGGFDGKDVPRNVKAVQDTLQDAFGDTKLKVFSATRFKDFACINSKCTLGDAIKEKYNEINGNPCTIIFDGTILD